MLSGDAFAAGAAADDDWLGLGATAGRIEFDNQATDEVNILDARVGIGTTTPAGRLHVTSATGQSAIYIERAIDQPSIQAAGSDNWAIMDGNVSNNGNRN